MRKEQFLKAVQPVPEHLRGTRQGLFHMLNAVVDTPAPPSAPPEPMRLVETPKRPAPENGVQSILQSDDFIFSD
jgi:hypothetical protein